MTSKIKVNLINDSGDNNLITSDGSGNLTTQKILYPAFYATSGTTDQSVNDNTTTKINLGTEVFDTDSAYDTSNSKFTVPTSKGGKYLINWSIDFLDTTENTIAVTGYLYKNGSVIHTEGFNANAPANAQFRRYKVDGTLILELSASDYLEIYAYANTDTGNAVTAKYDEKATYMQGYRVGS